MTSLDVTALLQFTFSGLTIGSIYAIVGLGLTIVFNASGVVNFAQGSYAVLGALTAVTLYRASIPIAAALPLAVLAVGAMSLVVHRLTVAPIPRADHFTSMSVTLGVSIVIEKLAQLVWGTEYFTLPSFLDASDLRVLGATMTSQAALVLATSVLIMAALYVFFTATRSGQALLACSENREAAGLVGISVAAVSWRAYVLGCMLGAFAGIIILPLATMNNSGGVILSIKGFAGCVLGGFGSPLGAVLGGLVLGLVEAYGAGFLSSGYHELIAFAVVILILVLRPGGVVGTRTLQA